MRGLHRIAALIAAAVLAAGCADDEPAAEPPAGTTGGAAGGTTAGGSARDVWPVGDAGEVELSTSGGRLVLVAVRPSPGWRAAVEEEGPEAVEVRLRQEHGEWTFRAARAAGGLEVRIRGERERAAPGAVPLGEAGTVVIGIGPGRSLAVASTSTSGWSVSTRTVNDTGEVVFTRGPERWRLSIARAGDRLDLGLDYSARGPAGG